MPKISTALHLPVVYHDIIRQLANDEGNYKFSTCPYSILQEFAIENEVMVTSHSEIERKLHIQCTYFSKVLKRFAFITDELNIPWDPDIRSTFSRDDSPLVAACILLALPSLQLVRHGN